MVHDHVEILGPTKSAPLAESPEPQPLHLEDGGSLVRYRNVWAIEKTNT
jgi:hypothetical protein